MDIFTVEATFEGGVLKPVQPLQLAEGQRVRVTVRTGPSRVEQSYGLMGWTGSVEDLDYLINSHEEGP